MELTLHGVGWGYFPKKHLLVGMKLDIQICTEKSSMGSLAPQGMMGVGSIKKSCWELNEMSRFAQTSHVRNSTPVGCVGGEVEVKYPKIFFLGIA